MLHRIALLLCLGVVLFIGSAATLVDAQDMHPLYHAMELAVRHNRLMRHMPSVAGVYEHVLSRQSSQSRRLAQQFQEQFGMASKLHRPVHLRNMRPSLAVNETTVGVKRKFRFLLWHAVPLW